MTQSADNGTRGGPIRLGSLEMSDDPSEWPDSRQEIYEEKVNKALTANSRFRNFVDRYQWAWTAIALGSAILVIARCS